MPKHRAFFANITLHRHNHYSRKTTNDTSNRVLSQESIRCFVNFKPLTINLFYYIISQMTDECLDRDRSELKTVADVLFAYLRDVIYYPAKARLDIEKLPEEFSDFGKSLIFFANAVMETTTLAKELADGNLNCALPSRSNDMATPLKMLHASLRRLTWQTQQVARGDYLQRVDFMGDFSSAFNNMTKQLEKRWKVNLDEKSRLERHMNLMLANCPDPILLFDRQKKLAHVSDSYLKCCEISSDDELIGLQVGELFAPFVSDEFLPCIENMFENAVSKRRTVEIEQDISFHGDGDNRHYQIKVTPMLDEDGKGEGVMVLLQDTTDISHARELAERTSRAKSDFLARMSHEMRTPMNAIIGMTSIYNTSDDPERKDYCVEKINEASDHLLGVINDVLDMSRIEAEKFELSNGRFDFRKMVERVVGITTFRVQSRCQNMLVNISPAIPKEIVTDEQRLAQVITNLLSNAVKFTPDGGDISLVVEMVSEDDVSCVIRCTVNDNGIGVSREQQERLFVPFEQADGGISRKFGGTGLGLAISKRIVEMMSGRIWVDSEIGKGASFIFEITVGKAATDILNPTLSDSLNLNNRVEKEASADRESEINIFKGKKILLAEDVAINREILVALLGHTGIAIDTANDGKDAFEKFTAAPDQYDLIFMDVHMPNMDGYETTRRIRSSGLPGADTIPIVAMTANVFREDVERCLECGMSSHLGKPINAEEVVARLKEYLL